MRIKNIIFVILGLFISNTICATEITMSLDDLKSWQDADGEKFYKVGIGQQFVLRATVSDSDRTTSDVEIEGLAKFNVLGQSRSMAVNMINGAVSATITHEITLQAKHEGNFILGPAKAKKQGVVIQSNKLILHVTQEQQAPSPARGNQGQAQVSCTISVDHEKAVIGQPIILKLRIQVQGAVHEIGISTSTNFPDFITKEIKQNTTSEETLNGVKTTILEKQFLLFPLNAGKKDIPPITINYLVPVQQKKHHGGLFSDDFFNNFLGQGTEQKQISSNPLSIEVNKLPEHNGIIDGVGHFTVFKAALDKNKVMVNEPITLSLLIEGKGNLDQIAAPKLILPDGCKYYDSKVEVEEDLTNRYVGGKKRFDFIIQATKPGTFEIPRQKFTFFDVTSQTFKTLQTEPQSITVEQGQEQPVSPPHNIQPPAHATEPAASPIALPVIKQDIHFIKETGDIHKNPISRFPWWLFVLFLGLPYIFYQKKLFFNFFNRENRAKSSTAYEKELSALIKNNNALGLHQLFLDLLSSRYTIPKETIGESTIESKLLQSGLDAEKVSEFLDYMSSCAQLHFASNTRDSIDQNKLLDKAKYWLLMLNK